MINLRHSTLPKLSVANGGCACFESSPGSSPAAQRGVNMDGAFRGVLMGNLKPLNSLDPAEKAAVEWAVEQVVQLSAGMNIIADEEKLKVSTPGISHIGTEDARVPAINLSFDLKSGQIRNYLEQMAAYALGNMEAGFTDKWTCILLFCDQRTAIRHDFTFEQAKAIVDEIIKGYTDPNKEPTPCDYCGWCKLKNTCVALVQPIVETKVIVEKQRAETTLEALKQEITATPERLSEFLKAAKVFEKELWDFAKDEAKRRLKEGEQVPGWALQTSKGQEYFTADTIIEAASATDASMKDVVDMMGGEITAKKFKDWAGKRGYFTGPEQSQFKDGITKLVEVKPKK